MTDKSGRAYDDIVDSATGMGASRRNQRPGEAAKLRQRGDDTVPILQSRGFLE
jgi:hypothetical protein